MTRTVAVLAALLLPAGTLAATPAYVYGPAPDWSRYRMLGEAAVRARLPDPSAFAVEWPNGYIKAGWRHKGRVFGYLSCGLLRATQPEPGFHAVTQFAVVIDHDQIQTVDISTRESNSLVNIICGDIVSHGVMPPASMMTQARDVAVAGVGMTIRAMPEGAYVVAVAPGSRAERAHMAPGMVITSANGVALAGMGTAMAAVLGSDAPSLALETATGERYDVAR